MAEKTLPPAAARPAARMERPRADPSLPACRGAAAFRSSPVPHSLAQGASSFGLVLHPLPERVGIVPVDIDLTVHVKLHTVAFSKCLDLSVVPGLLRKGTEGALRACPGAAQGARQLKGCLGAPGEPSPRSPTYLFSKLVAGKAQDA